VTFCREKGERNAIPKDPNITTPMGEKKGLFRAEGEQRPVKEKPLPKKCIGQGAV